MKVACEHPQIILHPLAGELIARYGNYHINGILYQCERSKRNLYAFEKKTLSPARHNISEDNIDCCFIANPSTGKRYPLYLQVSCGHCDACKASKVSSFVHRCELETMAYDSQPLFLTLTYNEENKPKEGVLLRDVQLFFKRFRINLQRNGYRQKIRYCCVSEYGKRTHRPHYHAIIWNLQQTDLVSYREIREILERSWNKGFIMARFVDPTDNKTFYYTAKYLRKDCVVPDGCNEPFICCSNRGGGIGNALLHKMCPSIRCNLDTEPKFANKWNGAVKPIQLNRFVLNKLFPSISMSIPSKVKKAMREYNLCMAQMYGRSINFQTYYEQYEKYRNFFGQYFYCPKITQKELAKIPTMVVGNYRRKILEAEIILEKWYNKGAEYFRTAVILDRMRERYLVKLFEHAEDITREYVTLKAYNYRRSAALAAQREIL